MNNDIIMEESLICECGCNEFWFFWGHNQEFVRCKNCLNEYKAEWHYKFERRGSPVNKERWLRRFNNETKEYENWEKSKITYKK